MTHTGPTTPCRPRPQRPQHTLRRRAGERGQAAGIEMVPFGVLVLVGGVLLVTNAWAVVDTRAALDAAARDYLREYTAARSSSAGRLAGRDAARSSLAARHRTDVTRITDPTAAFGPCRAATVHLELDVPSVRLPFVGGFGTTTVATTQTEIIQPYGAAIVEPGAHGRTPCD